MDMPARCLASDASNQLRELGAPRWSSRRLFAAAAVCLVLATVALAIDLPVAQYLKAHPLRGELARIVRLSEVFGWGGTVTILIFTAAALDSRGWRVLLPLAASSLGSGLIADGLKLLIARWRPSAMPPSCDSVSDTFIGWWPLLGGSGGAHGHAIQSFPSAHSATAAGLAAALAMLYPRGRWLFAAFAALAMFQRIEAQAHWCSDVLAGAVLGCSVAAAVQCSKSKVQG
jgi:membrane-associated phospholipid phosphatase